MVKKYNKPHRLHLDTTNRCNLLCNHCYRSASPNNTHYDSSQVISIINWARKAFVRKITLTGGEFFLRPDWLDIVREAFEACANIYILTNGTLLTQRVISEMAKEKVRSTIRRRLNLDFSPVALGVGISLDGFISNGLTRVYPNGKPVNYEELLASACLASENGLHVTINTTVTNKKTADELPLMYDILKNMPIDRWQIGHAFSSGRNKDAQLDHSTLLALKTSYRKLVECYIRDYQQKLGWIMEITQVFRHSHLSHGFRLAVDRNEHPCEYQFGSIVVEGEKFDQKFCPSLDGVVIHSWSENIDYSNLAKSDSTIGQFFNLKISDLPCSNCRYWKIFHGGCRANSLCYSGSLYTKDPVCCELATFVENEIIPLFPEVRRREFLAACDDSKE